MRKVKSLVFLSLIAIVFFAMGFGVKAYFIEIKTVAAQLVFNKDSKGVWPYPFRKVDIESSFDAIPQQAFFYPTQQTAPQPLVISLHTWSDDYTDYDPLAALVTEQDWNYIRPNFQGANKTPDACLSDKVLKDIDNAIQFAIDNGRVDLNNIFVVGVSGGAYTTLGVYLSTSYNINAYFAWVPISDLTSWYQQSKARGLVYADDILHCTSDGETFNHQAAKARSPLYMPLDSQPNGRLEIFAGINDGHSGTVPISHALLFYNRLTEAFAYQDSMIAETDIINLISLNIDEDVIRNKIEDRAVLYFNQAPGLSITVFDGGHEMLVEHTMTRIAELTK